MKRIIFILLIFTLSCKGQADNMLISKIIDKQIIECNLPLNISDVIGKVHLENKLVQLSETECKKIHANNKEWLIGDYYSYKALCYFKKDDYICLIYNRSYLPAEILDERSEFILSVFNHKGEFLSDFPIQGSYGDNIVFFGNINSNGDITINQESYDKNGNLQKTSTKYQININGVIVEMK